MNTAPLNVNPTGEFEPEHDEPTTVRPPAERADARERVSLANAAPQEGA
jgi:hypothetical protein